MMQFLDMLTIRSRSGALDAYMLLWSPYVSEGYFYGINNDVLRTN